MYYKRTLSKIIENASKTFPAVFITGPRQVGKTTIFEHSLEKERVCVSLDDPKIRNMAKQDPTLFFKTYTPPILIDEIQYAPELFPYIKIIIDKEKKNGLFWLTGSHAFQLMKNVTESLAGRAAVLNLQGLSQCEKMGKADSVPFLPSFELKRDAAIFKLSEFYELIWRGSYPRLLSQKEMSWTLFYDSYIETYIEKDIKSLINISQEHSFLKFLKVSAARTGQVLNYSEIAKDVEISVNTVKAWISLLETSGLIYLLYPYSNNITTRAIKSPKLYFFDTGLVCYLTGWDTVKVLENGAMSGALLETYIISDIIKGYRHNGQRPNIYYYRDRDQKEIDLIIEKNGALHPIEIKRSANPNIKDIKHFSVLKSLKKDIGLGALICLTDTPIALNKDVVAIPAAYL